MIVKIHDLTGRRIAESKCTYEFLAEILKGRWNGQRVIVDKHIPHDAKLIGVDFTQDNSMVSLFFEHQSFPVIINTADILQLEYRHHLE